DSYDQSSGHGSKLSLHDKKSEPTGVEVTSEPLSHTAARHKMSVKPKRTHGVPRKRRSTQLGEVTTLPATPEVNEESNSLSVGRSVTPDLPVTTGTATATTTQLKSASLPPGATPTWHQSPVKLSRSRSSATNRQLDCATVGEQDEPEQHSTFFGRLLSRRSGKKKKVVEEPSLELPHKRMDEKGRYVHEVTKLGRHHPASRQRVEPINISQERSVSRTQVFYPPSPTPPDSPPVVHKATETPNDENTLEGRSPLRKIIPLEVDSSIPKRTFVKKSQSFRRDEALPFVSLDTPSLPIGLGSDLQKDEVEDLNEFTTLEIVDHHISSERIEENLKDVTTTVTINSSETMDSCKVTVLREDATDSVSGLQVKKSASLDSIQSHEIEPSSKKSLSSESVTHQITIPVGSSVVNITQTVNEPRQNPPPHNIKPEPRKSLKEGNKEVPNFYPVPAPRPSKRESLESKPPRVPEFLRVQLNHVDSKPSVNVVLSTSAAPIEEAIVQDEIEKGPSLSKGETTENMNYPVRKNSKSDDIDVKVEIGKEETQESIIKKVDVCVAKEPVDPNQAKFLNSVKQWSASPYSISNPNYSIVSIAPRNIEVQKSPEKPIVSNQSVQKTVIIKDVKEKSPLVEKVQDVSPTNVVLRQRSFVNDDKPANILNVDKTPKIEEIKFAPRKKSLTKDVFVSDIDRSRKLSLEKLDSRNQENMNDFSKRKSKDISSSEDNIVDRNSYGSSDTLASQDSGDVVLRRKSLSREIIKQKEEEPELLKVFARRSLKVKDTEAPDDIETSNYPPMKSRDSDKENECGDSPPEERKKIKESLVETKVLEKSIPSVAYKYQRSISANNEESVSATVLATSKKDNNAYEKRQRSRTIPDPKVIDPPSSVVAQRMIVSILKEKEVEVISLDSSEEKNIEKEDNVPRFKRIQQRKEEWEKRAQLAMKKSHP
ncbi:hypothetical protein J6590_052012, partial [Homalodisca vitripennis]